MIVPFMRSWFNYAPTWRISLYSLKRSNLGAHRGGSDPFLSYNMNHSFNHDIPDPFVGTKKRSFSPIDLTSSPPQPTNRTKKFGKNITNSMLLRQLDDVYTSTQVRTLTTVTNPIPPVEPKSKRLPSYMPSRARHKVEKEWERTRLEKDLVAYTFKMPAGKIWRMRRTPEEIESERAERHWNAFQGKPTMAKIAVSPVHIPELHFCKTVQESNACLPKIKAGEMLSFDMEWEVDPITHQSKKTSVAQLASATDIYVLHLAVMPSIPEELLRILNDPTILKCGVAIKQDAAKFRKDFDKEVKGCLDLTTVAKRAEPERWKNRVGLIALRDLSRIYLNRKLDKSHDVRAGKWNNSSLDDRQCEYAANDVYVGVELIHTLAGLIGNLDPLKGGENIFQTSQFQAFLASVGKDDVQEKADVDYSKGANSKDAKVAKPISVKPSWSDNESDFEIIASEFKMMSDFESIASELEMMSKEELKVTPTTPKPASRPKSRPVVKKISVTANRSSDEQSTQMTKIANDKQSTSTKRKFPSEQSSPIKVSTKSRTATQYWKEGSTFTEIADRLRTPPYAPSTIATLVLNCLEANDVKLNESEKERLRIELQPYYMMYARRRHNVYLVKQDILSIDNADSISPEAKKVKANRRPSISSSSERSSVVSL